MFQQIAKKASLAACSVEGILARFGSRAQQRVEDGLAWEAHIIYAALHFALFLPQVYVIQYDPSIVRDGSERLPDIWETEDKWKKLGLALLVGINSQILLLDNYTDVAFIAMTATEDVYIDFCATSAVFFGVFWVTKIIIFVQNFQSVAGDTFDYFFLNSLVGLELIEPEVLPLFPCSKKCFPDCQIPPEEDVPNLASKRIKKRFVEKPFKVIRAGLEDYAQALIQLMFCAMHNGSTTAWLGVVVSFFFCIKNFSHFVTLLGMCAYPIIRIYERVKED